MNNEFTSWKLPSSIQEDVATLHRYIHSPPLFGREKKTCSLIERIVATGDPAVIPVIAHGLFSPSESIHSASSTGITKLLAKVPSGELSRLADRLPGCYYDSTSSHWGRLKPKSAAKYLGTTEDFAVGCLLSLHRNGYVRQAAERFLSGIKTGDEIRFLLARQNDWVDAIAESAQAEVLARLTDHNLRHYIKETEFLLHSLKYQRRDLRKTVTKYVDLLVSSRQPGILQEAIAACDKITARKLYHLLLQRDGDHLNHTIQSGLESDDEVVRQKCLRRAKDSLAATELAQVATKFLSDKSYRVRVEAFEALAIASPDKSIALWKKALLDRNRSVRETAIYFLDQADLDAASIYRSHLSRDPNSLPALSGLTACGDPSDLSLFSQYLDSPYASRRAEAVRGIGRYGNNTDIVELQLALTDHSKRVVRMAHQQLNAKSLQLESERLFSLLDHCKNVSGKNAVLRLLFDQGRWKALGYLIRAVAHSDAQIANQAESLVDELFLMNRVFTQPSAEQKKQIERAINESVSAFSDSFRVILNSYLSSYGFTV